MVTAKIFKVILKGIPYYGYAICLVLVVLLTRSCNDNKRVEHNFNQAIKENVAMMKQSVSLVTNYRLINKELKELVHVKFPALEAKLDSANIKANRVERIVVQEYYYRDTTSRKVDLQPVIEAIQKGVKLEPVPFIDKSPCLIIRGHIEYDGKRLELDITDREFITINEVVGHWQRRRWKLLGLIPTRIFGRKETVITVFNSCGESKTVVIDKIKNNGKDQ